MNKGYLPKTDKNYSYIYMICSFLISYCYFHEGIVLRSDLIKLYKGLDHLTFNERTWHYCMNQLGQNLKEKENLAW